MRFSAAPVTDSTRVITSASTHSAGRLPTKTCGDGGMAVWAGLEDCKGLRRSFMSFLVRSAFRCAGLAASTKSAFAMTYLKILSPVNLRTQEKSEHIVALAVVHLRVMFSLHETLDMERLRTLWLC